MGGDGDQKSEEEALYGREYLDWKRQTLGAQVSHHTTCAYDTKHDNDSDDEDGDFEGQQFGNEEVEYKLEMAHGYVKKGEEPRGPCLGLIVEGGYMFTLDPDMASFPLVTWHCPKYRDDGCPASFVTRITNPSSVRAQLKSPASHLAIAQSLAASHVMENLENIESHANHRPGYYKDNISPLIHGLFSREVRDAVGNLLSDLISHIAPCMNS